VFLVLLPLILPPTKKKKERKKEEEEGRKTTQSQIWTCSTFNKPNTPPLRR
jgi:hypothetical protein